MSALQYIIEEKNMPFSDRFLWGAATSAAQVEGAWDEDGKCPSIWDEAGNHIRTKETCHTACDHYHRFADDIQLMKEIGLNSYRFSVSMCRVMPEKGVINPNGLSFYKKLVKELKQAEIEPICTLYHWDLPVWAQKLGGWKNPKIVDWYLQYAEAVVSALSPDVHYWITFNEPQMFIMGGYVTGTMAPYRHDVMTFRNHHMKHFLLAHGKAVKLIRNTARDPIIGISMAASCFVPLTERDADIRTAYMNTFETRVGEGSNSMYMDPIALGKASPMLKNALSEADLKLISEPIDFIGLNIYQPNNMMGDNAAKAAYLAEGHPKTSMGWFSDGRCMYWTVCFYHERYHLPIMVTENGMADTENLYRRTEVIDRSRIEFMDEYLRNLKRAADEGIPVLGYQHWSLMDNFEWNEGYTSRFGLIHVNYDTQERTLKKSAYYYREIIESNGENI